MGCALTTRIVIDTIHFVSIRAGVGADHDSPMIDMLPIRQILLAASVVLLASCSSDSSTGGNSGTARVIFVHAITDTGNVDVRVATKLTVPFTAVPYGGGTDYQSVSSGTLSFTVQASPSTGSDTPIPLSNLSGIVAANGAALTIVAAGQVKDTANARAVGTTAYLDDISTPASGQARLRIINASSDAGAVDVYATAVNAVQSVTPTFAGVDFRSAVTRTIPSGSYTLTITPLSNPATVLAQAGVTMPSSTAQTVIVRGIAGTLPPATPASRRITTTVTTNVAP